MKFTIRTAEMTRDFQFILHSSGCKDIQKDSRTYGGYTEEIEGPTAKEATQDWLNRNQYDGPDCVYDSPWTVEYVKFLPCCNKRQS